MPLIRLNSITESTGRELTDAIDHLSACIADLVDVVSRNTALQERIGGWTPPKPPETADILDQINADVARTVRRRQYFEGAPTPPPPAVLDLTSARQHAEDRTDTEPQNVDDTPLIEREACS